LCPRINQETIEGKRVGKLCKWGANKDFTLTLA
jgi:hypothetical protein